ncbi:DUF2716 domain-containing protein [Streptomyces sp. NPDC002120]|uniref:DUF2716 domain-containing protein n=1 Tax=Streptomyces sp. NPDC002120 TaxID=3364631 RepID=UPI0036909443
MDIGGVLARYDEQVRGRLPEWPPVGAVVERDGPLVRTHYGTHGTVQHPPLPRTTPRAELAELVRRQQEAFAGRGEPAVWKVHGNDPPELAEELTAAGFAADEERSLLVAEFEALGTGGRDGVRHLVLDGSDWCARARGLALSSGPHAIPLREFEADGLGLHQLSEAAVLCDRGRMVAAGWAGRPAGTDFVVVGGLTGPYPELIRYFARLGSKRYLADHVAPYCLVEAHGELRTELAAAGFAEVTTVRTHRWAPADATPARTRPVRKTIGALDDGPVWDRLEREFGFRPSTRAFPGFDAPAPSATWSLDAVDQGREERIDQLGRITERALRAVTGPGDTLYWLDWQHIGHAFEPHRVGGPGRPEWPGSVYPDGDYHLYLDPGLRFGTFGHPWEHTLCVFGASLPAVVEAELTGLLGDPVRRRG